MGQTMKQTDLHRTLLRARVAVLDTKSEYWRSLVSQDDASPGVDAWMVIRRMAHAGLLQPVKRGVYAVVDPVRATPAIAVASGVYGSREHYITTDAALAFHRLMDQPVPVIRAAVPTGGALATFKAGGAKVEALIVVARKFGAADWYETRIDGFPVKVASRVQAVVDAVDHPKRMTHFSLLPEVLRSLRQDEVEEAGTRALGASSAAAQRLGFLLDEGGVPVPSALLQLHPTFTVSLLPQSRRGTFSARWRIRA